MNLEPLGSHILVEPFPPEAVTQGGIIVPETAQSRPDKSTVITVSKGYYAPQTGEFVNMAIKEGDVVFTVKGSGTPIVHENKIYYIHRDSDCLSRVPKENE